MLSYNMSAPSPYQEPDPDWMLIRAMATGDVRALNELYARYGGMILAFLKTKIGDQRLAEEILQDVMLAAWENAHRFEARSKVKTWLLVIARNRAINTYRKKRLPIIDINDAFNLQADDTNPMEAVVRKDRESSVREAIQKLPEIQREVLVLVFYHQLTGPEVAQVLNISEGTVKSRLHRAKEMLRRVLSQEDDL
jgi:RNA polymerase sigma-70 factor, ECF subfamily